MGRKKSKRTKLKPRVFGKLDTRFDCPKCNHERVVQCRIDKEENKGHAFCTVCEAQFRCSVHSLDRPVDIYHAWADSIAEKCYKGPNDSL
ncbi:hypothetical protein PAEPH01_0685 [Pancytospora epiphaga]|nr:hypothetical protein PAEPH01_0685 [Pancytospora epiphaga]